MRDLRACTIAVCAAMAIPMPTSMRIVAAVFAVAMILAALQAAFHYGAAQAWAEAALRQRIAECANKRTKETK